MKAKRILIRMEFYCAYERLENRFEDINLPYMRSRLANAYHMWIRDAQNARTSTVTSTADQATHVRVCFFLDTTWGVHTVEFFRSAR